tara:strand:+ start:2139 stop:3047 length:909 start_codon:yes stop_codon:yes gene_type:complete
MKTLRVNFVDFWDGFRPSDNYFYYLLSLKYNVELDEINPDVVFFSVFGGGSIERYLNHSCKKIFFTGENCRPNLSGPHCVRSGNWNTFLCDLSFSFDFTDAPNNYRLPLWVLQIDWFSKGGYGNPEFILPVDQLYSNQYISTPKSQFCAAIFNNPVSMRVEMYNKLSNYKAVTGYGRPFNNWFYGEKGKYETLSAFKFSICFENSISPVGGYYTEKLFHAKTSGTIPIYWTDDKCGADFNTKSFLNLNDYKDMDELIDYIIEIDNDDELYQTMLNEPLFVSKETPSFSHPNKVLEPILDLLC